MAGFRTRCFGGVSGLNLGKGNGTIFHPDTVKEIGELDFKVDESNFWVRRILYIIRSTGSRLGDRVCLGDCPA